jgi:hypothetical protein
VLGLLGPQPLHDAVDVEAVAALAPHQGTVITYNPEQIIEGTGLDHQMDTVWLLLTSMV